MKRISVAFGVALIALWSKPPQQAHEISAASLHTRLEAFAHDTMLGRKTGTRANQQATEYIVGELSRLGIAPSGDQQQFYQTVPVRLRQWDSAHTSISLNPNMKDDGGTRGGRSPKAIGYLPLADAFGLAMPTHADIPGGTGVADVVVGGRLGDQRVISPAAAAGKIVVFFPPLRSNGQPDYQLWTVRNQLLNYPEALAIFVATLDLMPRAIIERMVEPRMELVERTVTLPKTTPIIAVTRSLAEWAIRSDTVRNNIPLIQAILSFSSRESAPAYPVRNIVAVIEGSDPRLKSEYVVLSAHSDHLGVAKPKDRINGDSIFNGADDGGTGAMALLEIGQYIASLAQKPKRSIVLLWTTGDEQGLLGAEYFADHPTIARDNIVANIDVDMLGGASERVQVSGSRRLSDELGEWIERSVASSGLQLDAQPADERDRTQAYCEGDDWHFNRWGIPSARISTGRSADYRLVTDDISKIDFARYARATQLVASIVLDIANQPGRPRITKPKPDVKRACVW